MTKLFLQAITAWWAEPSPSDFLALNVELRFAGITPISISALKADNLMAASANTPWYYGPSLLAYLEDASELIATFIKDPKPK